jgi:hypothetical protein
MNMANKSYDTIEALMSLITQYIHNPESIAMITKAYDIAAEMHKDQKRKSGEPYIIHPLNVTAILAQLRVGPDTLCAGLLHDVCKADIYKSVMKEQKNSFGSWVDVPVYDVDYSNFPLGHGEKSVIVLLQCGLELTDEEIMAIRWHMHAWDLPFQSADIKGNLLKAKELYPLVSLIQAADGLSSNLLERNAEEQQD